MPVFLVQVKKGQGAAMSEWRMTYHQKQIAALRIWYRGGYTFYFKKQALKMLASGFTKDDLIASSVNDEMKRWVEYALSKVPQGD